MSRLLLARPPRTDSGSTVTCALVRRREARRRPIAVKCSRISEPDVGIVIFQCVIVPTIIVPVAFAASGSVRGWIGKERG